MMCGLSVRIIMPFGGVVGFVVLEMMGMSSWVVIHILVVSAMTGRCCCVAVFDVTNDTTLAITTML